MKKPLAEQWDLFQAMVLRADVSQIQRRDMRRAFYAGAQALENVMMRGVSASEEVTLADLELMASVSLELAQFGQAIGKGDV